MKKRAYFIGIAGKTMGQLAKAFKDMGWEVFGSDHVGVYPPVSTYLKENKIPYKEGYRKENVPRDVDLFVVGRSALLVDKNNPEYIQAKSFKTIPVLSFPEILKKYLIKDNSIVVAGTSGKSTITALVSWILKKAGLNPSYMIGAIPLNMKDGVKITDSDFSVVEGDETPAMRESDLPKFMYYKPKYVVLSATRYDHPEVYKTKEKYLLAVKNFLKLIPKEGLLVYNLDNVSSLVAKVAACRRISYSLSNSKADYFIKRFHHQAENIIFEICNKKTFLLRTSLLGRHNLENHCGAVALCSELGVKKEIILEGVKTFKGIKTRLEYLGKFLGRYFYWDFAQHPDKVRGTLEALKERFSHKRLICIYDPSATELKYQECLKWFDYAFNAADVVIVGKVTFLKKVSKKERVTGSDLVKAIARTQKMVSYFPKDEKIFKYLTSETKPGDVVVFMSSGGLRFTNLIQRVIQNFKKQTH